MQNDQQMQYVSAIVTAVNSLFDPESELKQYDWNKIDGTKFFTAFAIAGNYIFNKIVEEKSNLEFTHILNGLIVQDLLKDRENSVDLD